MAWTNKLQVAFKDFIDLIYPNLCITCGSDLPGDERYICPKCWLDMPKTNLHQERENEIEKVFWGRFPITYATSLFYFTKGSRYQKLIHEIKYQGKKEIGRELGKRFGAQLKSSVFSEIDYLVPVPLHKRKKRKRGFNQSEWIAKGMSETLEKPVISNNLFRITHTKTQTRKSRFERWKNVENVFHLKDKTLFEDSHILLVDDIVTTGATLEACANRILISDNVKVSIASLGYTAV
jgi:ComF family protein